MKTADVLVTGGSGFIGQHLATELIKQGYKVSLLLRPESILPDDIERLITRVNCNDWSTEGIINVFSQHHFSSILHLASYGVNPGHRDPKLMTSINVLLPSIFVELAAKWGANMLIIGSCSEYARAEYGVAIDESSQLESDKLYGASKAAGALYACAVAEFYKVHMRVLRLFNVYGAGESAHRLLPSLVKNLKKGERVSLSSGEQIRDFIYIKDAINAIVQVLALPTDIEPVQYSDVWNICTSTPCSVREFSETVANQLGVMNSVLGFGDIEMRPDDVPWVLGNSSKIYNDIGWKSEYSLSEGIADALLEMDIQV